jgi:hypothetical protein
MPALPSLDTRLYRAALLLYPASFREEFVHQIACDFDDARADVISSGRARDLPMFWLAMSRDLARSMATQWVRTGWPVIATVALGLVWLQFTALTSFWWSTILPVNLMSENDEAIIAIMLLAVVCVVIAATIAATHWIGRSLRRPARRFR